MPFPPDTTEEEAAAAEEIDKALWELEDITPIARGLFPYLAASATFPCGRAGS